MRKCPPRTFGTPFPKLAIDLLLLARTLFGRFLLPSMLAFRFLGVVRSLLVILLIILLIFNGELRLESSSGLERLLPFARLMFVDIHSRKTQNRRDDGVVLRIRRHIFLETTELVRANTLKSVIHRAGQVLKNRVTTTNRKLLRKIEVYN